MNCVRMRARLVVLLTAAVVGVVVVSPMLRARSRAATHTEETVLRLEEHIPELMKKDGVPGLSIALIRGGKTTWVHGFGIKEA